MNLHSLKNTAGARKRAMRVGRGRGSGKGKTCGRGHKGQMARAGHKHRPGFEGGQMPLFRRLPKRGFNHPAHIDYTPVNVGVLETCDKDGAVTVDTLRAAGLVRKTAKTRVKILGTGALEKKLTVKAHAFSAAAREKIEAAGGTCEIIS